jgi:CDP-paratose 2-epimerase
MSTNRVYPVRHLRAIAVEEAATRFEIADGQELEGVTSAGVNEQFPLWGRRTTFGGLKLSAEQLVEDYVGGYGLRAVVNRFGAIAGPWQGRRVHQDVFTHWMAAHYFRSPLRYLGHGGKQVRDLIHIEDVAELVLEQLAAPDEWTGHVGNVGGGRPVSLSLLEATDLCREITGNRMEIGLAGERDQDVALYLSDATRTRERSQWAPRAGVKEILGDVFEWIRANESAARALA